MDVIGSRDDKESAASAGGVVEQGSVRRAATPADENHDPNPNRSAAPLADLEEQFASELTIAPLQQDQPVSTGGLLHEESAVMQSDVAYRLPITTHHKDSQSRQNRIGIEALTHAPLNFRVFPPTALSINEFEMVDPNGSLGKGAMGSVNLVRWITRPDKPLRALKRISKFQMWKDDDPVMLFEQLWDEIEALSTLKHENIVGLDGYFEDYKYVYLVMEFASKGDFNQILGDQTRLSEDEVKLYIRQLINALLFCHEHNYLHRDVKPENLLLNDNGKLLLGDFGCVATVHSSRKSLCGTRHYHSYEIVQQQPHDEASDTWSVGIVTFELLSGRSPFESDEEDNEDEEQEEEDEETDDDDEADDDETEDNDDDDDDGDNENHLDEEDDDEFQDASSHLSEGAEQVEDCADDTESDGGETDEEDSDHEKSESDENSEREALDRDDDGDGASSTASSEDQDEVEAIYNRIRLLDYRFPHYFSENAISFIERLLDKERSTRMTLTDALQHPFLNVRR